MVEIHYHGRLSIGKAYYQVYVGLAIRLTMYQYKQPLIRGVKLKFCVHALLQSESNGWVQLTGLS